MITLVSIIISVIHANSAPTQHLHIQNLNVQQTMFEFTLANTEKAGFSDIMREQSLFSRSFLENLHVKAGVKQLYLSVTAGRIRDQSFNAPSHGVQIISNHDVQ
jgi:hypothetical protein